MFEHEPDSDDDFECYFLKPVNEYNITDKIKEANQELFETPKPVTPPQNLQRKVQFRKILEDYEDGGDNLSIISIDSNHQNEQHPKAHQITSILETNELETGGGSEYIEEICEEVVELDLDQIESTTTAAAATTATSTKEQQKNDDIIELDYYQRNPEIFNEIVIHSRQNSIEKLSHSSSSNNSGSDDDDLSVIVASYIESPKRKPQKTNKEKVDNNRAAQENDHKEEDNNNNNNKIEIKKKFSFRKKKKIMHSTKSHQQQQHDIKFNYKICCEYRNAIDNNDNEITVNNDKLPKYTGYLSEYGLSKEQWEQREKQLEKRKKLVLEHNLKASELDIQKMDDNERAFTRWLKNKIRFPVNKTKNMFDFKTKPKKSKK